MDDKPRYYLDESKFTDEPMNFKGTSRDIYDNHSGMLVLSIFTDAGTWTPERHALLETVLKAINADTAGAKPPSA
jgi:hypothetical protein